MLFTGEQKKKDFSSLLLFFCESNFQELVDFILKVASGLGAGLIGDKTWSAIFDNSKIKAFVPGFQATIPFRQGIRRTLAWFDADEKRRWVNPDVNAEMDAILEAYAGR